MASPPTPAPPPSPSSPTSRPAPPRPRCSPPATRRPLHLLLLLLPLLLPLPPLTRSPFSVARGVWPLLAGPSARGGFPVSLRSPGSPPPRPSRRMGRFLQEGVRSGAD